MPRTNRPKIPKKSVYDRTLDRSKYCPKKLARHDATKTLLLEHLKRQFPESPRIQSLSLDEVVLRPKEYRETWDLYQWAFSEGYQFPERRTTKKGCKAEKEKMKAEETAGLEVVDVDGATKEEDGVTKVLKEAIEEGGDMEEKEDNEEEKTVQEGEAAETVLTSWEPKPLGMFSSGDHSHLKEALEKGWVKATLKNGGPSVVVVENEVAVKEAEVEYHSGSGFWDFWFRSDDKKKDFQLEPEFEDIDMEEAEPVVHRARPEHLNSTRSHISASIIPASTVSPEEEVANTNAHHQAEVQTEAMAPFFNDPRLRRISWDEWFGRDEGNSAPLKKPVQVAETNLQTITKEQLELKTNMHDNKIIHSPVPLDSGLRRISWDEWFAN